jgi:hypothetical protein
MNKPKLPPSTHRSRIVPGSTADLQLQRHEILRQLSRTLLDEPYKYQVNNKK